MKRAMVLLCLTLCLFTANVFGNSTSAITDGFETGDFSSLAWAHQGPAWGVTPGQAHAGSYGAQSGVVGDAESSTLSFTCECIAGEIRFAIKVSSEENYDYLIFRIDGEFVAHWSGEKAWTEKAYSITDGMHTFTWSYEKDESKFSGQDTAWIDTIYIPVPTSSEGFEGEDFSSLAWEHLETPWMITDANSNTGSNSARSGEIEDNEISALSLTYDCQDGSIGFALKVSSEEGWDKLVFLIDDQEIGAWSGEQAWIEVNYPVTAGTHTFIWSYEKDKSKPLGDDAAWIDDVVFRGTNKLNDPQVGAEAPYPADEDPDVMRDTVLSWTPGDFEATYDVYIGTDREEVNHPTVPVVSGRGEVNNSTVTVVSGLDVNTFDPGRLELGLTYYWRVDEVMAVSNLIVFKGNIWSFTVEPLAYPIPAGTIVATAWGQDSGVEDASKTIDGSGLDANDLHSNETADMWLSDPNSWDELRIQYEFDNVYKLHEMLVWNYNGESWLSWLFGCKDVVVEYSEDGEEWSTLDYFEFAQAPGTDDYAPNTVVDFSGLIARHVLISPLSNWGWGMFPQFGLSEVRFQYIPVRARAQSPAEGSTEVGSEVVLSWRAGREADFHEVYISTDVNAVIDRTVPMISTVDPNVSVDLDPNQTYYWCVDEVNEADAPSIWPGDVWSFSTAVAVFPDGPADMNFVDIPGGTFEIGDHSDVGDSDEKPLHTVTLTAFKMSRYETTNAQYAEYLNAALADGQIEEVDGVVYAVTDVNQSKPYCDMHSYDNDSQIEYGQGQFTVRSRDLYDMADHPVVDVSWYGAQAFCDYYGYRLPTEAEWEYAARGGYHDPYYRYPWGSNQMDYSQANCESFNPLYLRSHPYTSPVGHYGVQGGYELCDMSGNVREWCQDWYGSYSTSEGPAGNPVGPYNGSQRVIRGGSWHDFDFYCTVSVRDLLNPGITWRDTGFRVCR